MISLEDRIAANIANSKLKVKAPGNQIALAPSKGYGDKKDRRSGNRRRKSHTGPYFQLGGPHQGGRRNYPDDRRIRL